MNNGMNIGGMFCAQERVSRFRASLLKCFTAKINNMNSVEYCISMVFICNTLFGTINNETMFMRNCTSQYPINIKHKSMANCREQ